MKRVLVAAMHHESNSFNPIVAGENEFRVLRGQEFFENFRDNDSLTGVVKTLMDAGYEVVPAVSCRAVPNGEVDYDFDQGIKNEILEVARKENEKNRWMPSPFPSTAPCGSKRSETLRAIY